MRNILTVRFKDGTEADVKMQEYETEYTECVGFPTLFITPAGTRIEHVHKRFCDDADHLSLSSPVRVIQDLAPQHGGIDFSIWHDSHFRCGGL